MRLFAAVALTEAVRAQVAALQERLKAVRADVRWVEPESLHLTLQFFGEVTEAGEGPLRQALAAAAGNAAPFRFRLEGIGAFPRTTAPKIVWLGVTDGHGPLVRLAGAVEEQILKLGYAKEERPFSPHLTIGRVRSNQRLAHLIKELQVVEFRAEQEVPADSVALFQSHLSPKGATYSALERFPLTRTAGSSSPTGPRE